MKKISLIFLLYACASWSQTVNTKVFAYSEFMAYVKKYHPAVKSANLKISAAQASLLMARGAFDPKIEVDFDQKKFGGKEYYSLLNSSFKIPTWYGIEVKAGFDNNEGIYLNPENKLPNQGMTSLGISIPLDQGLWINQRMADLKRGKLQLQLSEAERKLEAIGVLYDASCAYFSWKKSFSEMMLYEKYLSNARLRYDGVTKLIAQGDKPAIDSIEAGITVRNRELSVEEARLKLAKAKLELSNFLWLENNVPLELQDGLLPEENLADTIAETLRTDELMLSGLSVEAHPKISAWQKKIEILDVERKLKANMLLPKIDLGYSYLSEPGYFDDYRFQDYKIGVNVYFPLFLRKERGSLKITKYKLQDSRLSLELERVQLTNKVKAQQTEIQSLARQRTLIGQLVRDNETLLASEDRLFSFGESSVFLINSRENNLVSAQLSQIAIENRFLESNASLFKIMANPD